MSKSLYLATRICLVFSGSQTRWCGFTGSDMATFLVSTLGCSLSHSLKVSFATSILYRYDSNSLAWLYLIFYNRDCTFLFHFSSTGNFGFNLSLKISLALCEGSAIFVSWFLLFLLRCRVWSVCLSASTVFLCLQDCLLFQCRLLRSATAPIIL